jgi:hypothetical protein
MLDIYKRTMAVAEDAVAPNVEIQMGPPTEEGGRLLGGLNRQQNVHIENLDESRRELRVPARNDRIEAAAPQTAVKVRRSDERGQARVVHNPSDAYGSVIEPDARRVTHASI